MILTFVKDVLSKTIPSTYAGLSKNEGGGELVNLEYFPQKVGEGFKWGRVLLAYDWYL